VINKKNLLIMAVIGCTALFLAAGLAIAAAPDVIPMETAAYKKHTKGIIQFTHTKHATDYGAKCGDCHHDKDGKPLNDLTADSPVQKCVACHAETGKMDKDDKKLSDIEKTKKYHKEALHENCSGCHKESNKAKGLKKNDPKAAPEKSNCKGCHPKK
jgi:hypothetical protein